VIEEYREHLPVSSTTPVVSLLEGGTPLIEARRLSEQVGAKVWLKVEGANPTARPGIRLLPRLPMRRAPA
jgi:threonine synthase